MNSNITRSRFAKSLIVIIIDNYDTTSYYLTNCNKTRSRFAKSLIVIIIDNYDASLYTCVSAKCLKRQFRAVNKGRAPEIFPSYLEVYPQLLPYKTSMLTSLQQLESPATFYISSPTSKISDRPNQNAHPFLDQNGSKRIPFGATHTYKGYIGEYPPPPASCDTFKACWYNL